LADRGANQAAAVVLDNATGEVLAWVGSPDFWADTAGQVDMVLSPRQPGSALKPFLYALAFDRGYTPATILPDIARVYQTATGPYRPRNYDRRFHGPVRAREALASSYNLPAVDLANSLGVGSLLHLLRSAGFSSLDRSAEYYGLGLSLGNGDVTLLELANGYRALAVGGLWRPWHWRATGPGEPVEPGRRVVSARAAALVLDILADPVARIPGFGVETPLDFPFPVAAKTGTSRHFTDNWAVGATGGFTVAVWVGNFSGRPMDGVSGVSGAGPLLHRAVLLTATRHAAGTLPAPAAAGAQPVAICRLSGLRATPRCPAAVEWFAPGTAPARSCDWHGSEGVVLPAEFAEWAQEQGAAERASGATASPPGAAPSPANDQPFRILSPQEGDVYRVPAGVEARYATVALRAAGGASGSLRWFVDGRPHADERWPLARGRHRIRAIDAAGDWAEVAVAVE
jgi:penicillin-binding protein 1C